MIITLCVDASYDKDFNIAGYAYWLASNRGKFKHSDCLCYVESSSDAELIGAINSVRHAFKAGHIKQGDNVRIQCDNSMTVNCINTLTYSGNASREFSLFKYWITTINIKLCAMHVKGHSESLQARHLANNLVDSMARSEMRGYRKYLKKFKKSLV